MALDDWDEIDRKIDRRHPDVVEILRLLKARQDKIVQLLNAHVGRETIKQLMGWELE